MEYVPSIKINNTHEIEIMNFNKILISEKLLECFFTQIIQYGFVHIDPHPGNVGISKDGKIVFYDYGMFVKLDGVMKDKLKTLFLAMYDRDVDEVCNLLIELEIITVEPSKKAYFKKFIASFIIYIDNLNVDDFKLSYLDKIDQSEMQFLISSKFLLLLRGITILEGVCKNLNPNFNYRDILDPYISDFIIDINYIERRGEKDISRFTKAPDKITSSEISLGMIENDVDQLKKKLINFDLKTKYILSTILVVQELQVHSWESKIILASAFLYILLSR
jgi:predicted unusual protein kinase regulating ubiquinone biosynthesis (AarF/ABC1/UbiB family)